MLRGTKLFKLAVLALLAIPALAQLNANVSGVITDPTGAVIPGAQITLLNQGTQAKQNSTTNDQGFFRFNQLPAGNYTLSITAPGFQSKTISSLHVAADLPQTANATLEPNTVQSSVTVSAATVPALQTSDASISGTITSQAAEELPTFGRDPYELIRTVPGATGTGARSGTGNSVPLGNTQGPGQSNYSIFQTENQVQVSSAGQRVEQNVYYVDGVNVNSLGWGGAAVITPNTESVQDMTIITADYDAADGRGSGAHIKTTTKAGTNAFHGSGLFLYQDPNLNAYNKWGGPNSALPVRVENNFRQYAASVGGPILKNKLFFFLSYEGLHSRNNTYGQAWVTTPQYRQLIESDLSELAHREDLQQRECEPTRVAGAQSELQRFRSVGIDDLPPGERRTGCRLTRTGCCGHAVLSDSTGGRFDGRRLRWHS